MKFKKVVENISTSIELKRISSAYRNLDEAAKVSLNNIKQKGPTRRLFLCLRTVVTYVPCRYTPGGPPII